jgi:hypothetical protein
MVRRHPRALIVAAIVLGGIAGSGRPARGDDLEYQVKAAFLLNFAKFTEFPASSFDRDSAPVTICVIGTNPFGGTLADTLHNERAGGRRLETRTIGWPAEARACQMVFVPRSQTDQIEALVSATSDRGVVLVGESGTFLERGGTINLFVENGRVRFAMNPAAVERAGVRFSSHLLRLARSASEPRGSHDGAGGMR